MWIDFNVQRTGRRCSVTDRPFTPGEEYYSLLTPSGDGAVQRRDFCREAWPGPPPDGIGWWLARIPDSDAPKAKLAPGEVMLDLFERWADEPDRIEARYVLGLLMVRRRLLKLEETKPDDAATAADPTTLRLYSPARDAWYEATVAEPDSERVKTIQAELVELLYAGAA